MRTGLLIFSLLALAGCVSQQQLAERQAQRQAEWDAQDEQTCLSYGVARGTDGYVACRMNLANSHAANDAAAAANQERASEAMLGAGLQLMQGPPPPTPAPCIASSVLYC